MSARFNVPGLGTVTRDGSGAWILEGNDGKPRPIPAEYRIMLDQFDAWQRMQAAKQLSMSKLSPRVPALWDGPMPGDKSHSFSRAISVLATATADYFTRATNGNIFIRSINYYVSGKCLTVSYLDDIVYLTVLLNGGEYFRLRAPNDIISMHVNLIVPPGDVIIRVSNTTQGALSVTVGADLWERVPPVKR